MEKSGVALAMDMMDSWPLARAAMESKSKLERGIVRECRRAMRWVLRQNEPCGGSLLQDDLAL